MPSDEREIGFLKGYGWIIFGTADKLSCVDPGVASKSDTMKEQMGSWLQHLAPWDVFFTGTWSRPITLDGVLYGTRRYLKMIEKWAGIPIYAYFGVERGDKGHLLHVHALMGNVGHLKCFCGTRMAQGKWGLDCCLLHGWPWGYARAERYDPNKGAARYVSKYVTKRLAEYDLVGFPAVPQSAFTLEKRRK